MKIRTHFSHGRLSPTLAELHHETLDCGSPRAPLLRRHPLRTRPSRLSFWSTAPSPMAPDGSRWRTFSRATVTRYELSRSLRRVSRQTWLRRAAFSIRQVLVCWSATVMAG